MLSVDLILLRTKENCREQKKIVTSKRKLSRANEKKIHEKEIYLKQTRQKLRESTFLLQI